MTVRSQSDRESIYQELVDLLHTVQRTTGVLHVTYVVIYQIEYNVPVAYCQTKRA